MHTRAVCQSLVCEASVGDVAHTPHGMLVQGQRPEGSGVPQAPAPGSSPHTLELQQQQQQQLSPPVAEGRRTSPPAEAAATSPPTEGQPTSPPGGDVEMAHAPAPPAAGEAGKDGGGSAPAAAPDAPAGEGGAAAAGPGPGVAPAAAAAPAPVVVYKIPASSAWFSWNTISPVEREGALRRARGLHREAGTANFCRGGRGA